MCESRVALVTGAAGTGMGRSIALTLAREGAAVVVNYRNSQEQAEAIVQHIEDSGGKAMALQGDVCEETDCRRLVQKTVEQYGSLDICVIGPGGGWHPEPPEELSPSDALEDMRSELAPVYNLLPQVLPGMYERKWGRVIGISMNPPYRHPSPSYSYNAAKSARTESLLLLWEEAWGRGVTVNVLGPGPVPGDYSLDQAIELCEHGSVWTDRDNISPQDPAEGVAFLCSEAGRFISGFILPYWFR